MEIQALAFGGVVRRHYIMQRRMRCGLCIFKAARTTFREWAPWLWSSHMFNKGRWLPMLQCDLVHHFNLFVFAHFSSFECIPVRPQPFSEMHSDPWRSSSEWLQGKQSQSCCSTSTLCMFQTKDSNKRLKFENNSGVIGYSLSHFLLPFLDYHRI